MPVFGRDVTDSMHFIWRHVQDGRGLPRDDRPDSVFFRSGWCDLDREGAFSYGKGS
nr:MAG TPA: hypothetical protein [Caudoviricetes sp.]